MSAGNTIAELIDELLGIDLRRREVEAEKKALNKARAEVRQQMASLLHESGLQSVSADIAGAPLELQLTQRTKVHYDDALLRDRLGDRYGAILEADTRLVKQHYQALVRDVGPAMFQLGKPSRQRVKEAIESGVVRPEEFAGAFQREVAVTVSVKGLNRALDARAGEG